MTRVDEPALVRRERAPRDGAWWRGVAFAWALVFLVIAGRVWLRPERNTVFRVFRLAGERWLASANPYANVGEFLYSPLVAAGFAPFALLPPGLGGLLWRALNAAVFLPAVWAMFHQGWFGPLGAKGRALAFALLLPLAVGNFNNGQASPLVVGLLIFAVLLCQDGRWFPGALCVAVAAYFKIYPLAVGLLLLALYPRRFGWRLVAALLGLGLVSLLLQRPGYVLEQYSRWVHNLGVDPRRTEHGNGDWRDLWFLLRFAHVPIGVWAYAVVQAFAGAAVAWWCWRGRARGWGPPRLAGALFGLGCAWMTLCGPATESATYVLLAPALAGGLAAAWERSRAGAGTPRVAARAALAAYGLLVVAEGSNAWWPAVRQAPLGHAIQPVGALAFALFVIALTRSDAPWGVAFPGPDDNLRVPPTTRICGSLLPG